MQTQELALAMESNGVEAGEAVLLRRAKAGDLAAFDQLMVQHERLVFLTAVRLLGRPEDAQDAAQEVFLRLYKHLWGFDDIRNLKPWLYRVTVNVCRDLYRSRQKGAMLSLEDIREMPGKLADPQVELAEAEQRRIIAEGLMRLSEKERAALVLRDIQGLTSKEVARILGSREGTVRVQVASARLKIKKFAERFLKRRL